MKKTRIFLFVLFLAAAQLPFSLSFAQHNHGGGSSAGAMKMDTREVLVEGAKVAFHIMPNKEHLKMLKTMKMKGNIEAGTTHNISVVLTDRTTLKEITDASVSMKVVDPKGKDQMRPLKYEDMMKTYEAYFQMKEKGKYQVMIVFKRGEERHTAGIYYDLE